MRVDANTRFLVPKTFKPLKFDAELAVVLLAAHFQLLCACLLAMDF